MAKPAASRTGSRKRAQRTQKPTLALIVLYLVFALVFVVVAFYTVLHLVFFGFSGEPVGVDLGAAFLLPLAWAVGILRTVKLRATPVSALFWGYSVIGVLVIALVLDTVRFQPILAG